MGYCCSYNHYSPKPRHELASFCWIGAKIALDAVLLPGSTMAEITKAKVSRPTAAELHERVVAAIEKFIAMSKGQEWHAALSSEQYQLLIDDRYRVLITQTGTGTADLFMFAVPLAELRLDPWSVELGGGVKMLRSIWRRSPWCENWSKRIGGCRDLSGSRALSAADT
jgi:hypothetical protein